MEDARIFFSHFVTVDIPKGSCYSSEHLDTVQIPFTEMPNDALVILTSSNIKEGHVCPLPHCS